jgi:membrane-associated HD superfamily phosphohydrolase
LDECDLTFADLEKIENAFHRALVGMYHHRVDYPGFDFGRQKSDRPAGEVRPFRNNG